MDAYARAIIGVKVAKEDLVVVEKRKSFHHTYPETMKFCPETGKPLWETYERFLIPELSPENFTGNLFGATRMLDVYDDNQYDNEVMYYFIGIATKESDCVSFIEIPYIEQLKEELKFLLGKHDLWDESAFGVYCKLRYS